MPRLCEFKRHGLAVMIAAMGIPSVAGPLFADSVPESIRIQERAEKAYESHPVVPIDRGNAHHRDGGKDEGTGGDGTGGANGQTPPPSSIPGTRHDSNN
jgi:hypothetical protein